MLDGCHCAPMFGDGEIPINPPPCSAAGKPPSLDLKVDLEKKNLLPSDLPPRSDNTPVVALSPAPGTTTHHLFPGAPAPATGMKTRGADGADAWEAAAGVRVTWAMVLVKLH